MLLSLHNHEMKMPNFTFYRRCKSEMDDMVLKNSTPGEFAGIIVIEIERMQIPFFAAVTVVVS